MVLRRFATAIATLAFTVTAPLANAQPAPPEKPPGLPMWVIRDADSTIYVTGTVHRLRDGMEWRSPKLEAAMAEAKELWLELGEIADPGGLEEALHPVLEAFAAYDGTPRPRTRPQPCTPLSPGSARRGACSTISTGWSPGTRPTPSA